VTWSGPAPFDLTGRTALVTGAGQGIGSAIAVGLALAGAELIVHARSPERLAETVARVEATGTRVRTWTVDLAEPERIPAEAAGLPPVDILVNNAGIINRAPAVEQSYEMWRQVLTVNLDAAFQLTRVVGSGMVERGYGKIINVASLLAFQGGINVAGYTASKHAITGLTRALANEWTVSGVRVNAIAPGYITTENTRPLREDARREQEIRGRIPAGRWGTPEDVAGAAVFLAAPASDYVAGHVLVVDGGWMAR
jgi:2-dehydro-3-deoxy-D-gluconate 5-dehydrogenase